MGVDTLKTVQYSATGLRFRARPGAESQLAVAEVHQQELLARRSTSRSLPRASTASACRARTRRTAAASSRSSASSRSEPDDHRRRRHAVGAAARDLDDAARLPARRGGEERDRRARRRSAARSTTSSRFIGDNKAKVNGYINDQNLVERVETWIDNPFLGDMPFEAIYTDYKDVGGAQFPMHIVQKQGGYPIFDLTLTDVKANAPVNIQAPQGAAAPRRRRRPPRQRRDVGEARRRRLPDYRRLRGDRGRLQGSHHDRRDPARARRAAWRSSPKRNG